MPPVVTETRAATRSATLRVVADVDAVAWAVDHARGLRPDASPYGLHGLTDHGFEVSSGQPPVPSGGLSRRIDGTLRHRGGGFEWWARARTATARGTDVTVCWDERTGVPALVGPSRGPVATGVIWLPDGHLPAPWSALARRALGRSAAVWTLSSAALPSLRTDWSVPASRLHHLPFGIDVAFWSPAGRAVTTDAPPVVLGVGNDRHRDHAGLIAAVAGLPARLSLVSALPVEVPARVGKRIAELDHVALRSHYEQAAVVAVLLTPNTHVSGVTTVLEAQAMGRPLVVSDTPGMREYVRAGITAEVVPVGDTAAAHRAVAGLLADADRAAAMGAAGRVFARDHAGSARMIERLAAILQAV